MTELACCDTTPTSKQYKRKLRMAVAGYMVFLLLAVTFLRAYPLSPWRIPVMLLPVIPSAWGVFVALQYVRAMDELQRKIHLEGVAFAFTSTVLITVTWGMMERAGLPHLPSIWVASLMISLWGVGNHLAARRYR